MISSSETQKLIQENNQFLQRMAAEMLKSCLKDIDFAISIDPSDDAQILIDAKAAIETYLNNQAKAK